MSGSPDDGGPAFPLFIPAGAKWPEPEWQHGMSLRDAFALAALGGILAGPCSKDGVPVTEWFDAPSLAYQLADAMLAERKRKP